jgi:hypothetical protein
MSKIYSYFLISIVFLITMSTTTPASGTLELEIFFNQTYGGKQSEYASFAVETNDNGFLIAGFTNSYGAGDADIWLLKIDSNGVPEWNKTYGTPGFETSHYIIKTDDNAYLITGRTNYYGAGDLDLLLLKVDQDGNLLWNRTMGGAGDEWMWEIEKTNDGGYVLAGRTNSYGTSLNDYWLLKTDAEGNPEWNVTLGGIEDDRARSLLITDDGGYLIHGWSRSYGAGNLDFWLVKTDQNGNPQWNKTYGGIENERGIPLIKSNDGGYVLAGSTASYGAGANDFYLVKTDVNGDMIWNKTFGGESGETAGYLLNTVDGGYALVGYTESFGAGKRDIYMVLTDSEGNLVWNKTFGGPETEGVDFCIDTLDGGYLIGGHTQSYGNGEDDYYIIKLNPISQEPEPEPEFPPLPPLPPILSNLAITPAELESGGEVTIGLDIENIDSQSFTYIVTMQIGELTLLVDVELGAYESKTVSRTITLDMVGVFNVTVDGLSGSFTVKAPPKPAEFEFSSLRIFYPGVNPPEVKAGQTVTITISIEAENVGELEGGHTVELKVDGEVIDSKEVTLGGGASETVLFEVTRGEGTYEVEVEGITDSFTVNPQPSFWDKIPGFPYESILLGLVTVIIVLWLLSSRKMTV